MNHNLFLKADPQLTFSINTQIKEQLKWLIGTGKIKPGDMLPSAQQLADELGLNRNTINLVYTQLRDEGIVNVQKGRGTVVSNGEKIAELQQRRVPMYDLLNKVMTEASEHHFDLQEFAVAGIAFVQLFKQSTAVKPKVLFIECREHDHLFYRNEIQKHTGAAVEILYIEDIQESGIGLLEKALTEAELVITTLNHSDEVKDWIGAKKRIITIGATIDFSNLMEIAKLSSGTKVAFVCLGMKGGQWMAQRAKDAGIEHVEMIAAGTNNHEYLQSVIDQSAKVYASTAVYEELKAIAPDKVVHYPLILEKSCEKALAEAFDS